MSGFIKPRQNERYGLGNASPERLAIHKEALDYVQDIGRKRGIEAAFVYDDDGNEIFRKTGNENSVNFEYEEAKKLKGKTIVHNHPGNDETSLSFGDFNLTAKWSAKEIVAVTPKGTQFVGSSEKQLEQFLYQRVMNKTSSLYKESLSGNVFNKNDSQTFYFHAMNVALKEKGVVKYAVETPSNDFTKLIEDNKQLFDDAVKNISDII